MLLSWTLLKPCSFFPPLIKMKRVKELSAGGGGGGGGWVGGWKGERGFFEPTATVSSLTSGSTNFIEVKDSNYGWTQVGKILCPKVTWSPFVKKRNVTGGQTMASALKTFPDDSNLICWARLSPLHLHSSFRPCLGIALNDHLSSQTEMSVFSRILMDLSEKKNTYDFLSCTPNTQIHQYMYFQVYKTKSVLQVCSSNYIHCKYAAVYTAGCITSCRLQSPFLVLTSRVSDPIIWANKAQWWWKQVNVSYSTNSVKIGTEKAFLLVPKIKDPRIPGAQEGCRERKNGFNGNCSH